MSEWRTNRGTGQHYPVHTPSGNKPRTRCPRCGQVCPSTDLIAYGNQCWYCWVDTSKDETAQFIRSKPSFVMKEKMQEELAKRRHLRWEQEGAGSSAQ